MVGRPAAALAALGPAGGGDLTRLLFSNDDEDVDDNNAAKANKAKRDANANANAAPVEQEDATRASVEWAVPLARSAPGPGKGIERAVLAVTFAAQSDADEALLRLQRKATARLAALEKKGGGGSPLLDSGGAPFPPAGAVLAAEADARLDQLVPSDDASLASFVAAPKAAASSAWPGAVLGGGISYASAAAAVAALASADEPQQKKQPPLYFETSPEGCPPALATVGDAVRCLWSSPRTSAWAVADAGGWRLAAYASEELKSAVEGCVCARGALLTTAAAASSLPAALSPSLGGPLPCVLAVEGGEWWSSLASSPSQPQPLEESGKGDGAAAPAAAVVVPADPRLASAVAAGVALRLKNAVPAADGAQIARVLAGSAGAVRDYASALAALERAVAERRARR